MMIKTMMTTCVRPLPHLCLGMALATPRMDSTARSRTAPSSQAVSASRGMSSRCRCSLPPKCASLSCPVFHRKRIVRGVSSLVGRGNPPVRRHPNKPKPPKKNAPTASASVSSTSSSSSVESTTKGISSSRVRSAPRAREMRGSWRVAWIRKPTSSCLWAIGWAGLGLVVVDGADMTGKKDSHKDPRHAPQVLDHGGDLVQVLLLPRPDRHPPRARVCGRCPPVRPLQERRRPLAGRGRDACCWFGQARDWVVSGVETSHGAHHARIGLACTHTHRGSDHLLIGDCSIIVESRSPSVWTVDPSFYVCMYTRAPAGRACALAAETRTATSSSSSKPASLPALRASSASVRPPLASLSPAAPPPSPSARQGLRPVIVWM